MTSPELEYLAKVIGARTKGPWRLKIHSANTIESESVAAELVNDKRRIAFTDWHRICSLDMYFGGTEHEQHKNDISFIALIGTCADEIEAVIRAADRYSDCVCEFGADAPASCGEYYECLDIALDALKAKIKGAMG